MQLETPSILHATTPFPSSPLFKGIYLHTEPCQTVILTSTVTLACCMFRIFRIMITSIATAWCDVHSVVSVNRNRLVRVIIGIITIELGRRKEQIYRGANEYKLGQFK